MRDLLYLSETKMRALAPQLPQRIRQRLGLEAGLNLGMVSIRTTLPAESAGSSLVLLDAVVAMIEQEQGSRWRTDEVRAGDWIQFEEDFHYGSGWPGRAGVDVDVMAGLVYFAASAPPPLVLCGSAAHVVDRRQPGDPPSRQVGVFYMDAVRAYAREVAGLPDEAAAGTLPSPAESRSRSLAYALSWLCRVDAQGDPGWTGPVRLAGHARVLAVPDNPSGEQMVLATPLYVQYALDP